MKHQIKEILCRIPLFKDYFSFHTIYYECSSFLSFIWHRWIQVFPKLIYWPHSKQSEIRGRVIIGKGARVGHRPNCIIQGRGKLFIGDYAAIGPNTVIISGNHAFTNQEDVVRKETIIGDYCWVASSCNILAGVVLGPRTVVGAGSVVTKSFPNGYCVIAGNPARVIKEINKDDFYQRIPDVEYYGYVRRDIFEKYGHKYLSHIKFDYNLSEVTNNHYLKQLLNQQ